MNKHDRSAEVVELGKRNTDQKS